MKKAILSIAFVLVASIGFSQTTFDKLEDLDDVTSFVLTKDAFELLKKFPDAKSKDMEIFNQAKGLEQLQVFTTENSGIASQMESMVNKAIKTGRLTQLMRAKDKGSRVKIYVKSTKNKDLVSEVLMFVKSIDDEDGTPNTSIVSLLGEIDVNKLSEIADDFQNKKGKK